MQNMNQTPMRNGSQDTHSLGYVPIVIEQSGRGERSFDIY